MRIEIELTEYICERYGTLKFFAEKADIKYTTLMSILKRGIMNSSVDNIIKICSALNISVDKLSQGVIERNETLENAFTVSNAEMELLNSYRELSEEGKVYVRQQMIIAGLIYKKSDTVATCEA